MGMMTYRAVRVVATGGARFLSLALMVPMCVAQAIPPKTATPVKDPAATGPAMAIPIGSKTVETGSALKPDSPMPDPKDTIDRVIAIVNGDLVLESDVDEERRFSAFSNLSRRRVPPSRETMRLSV